MKTLEARELVEHINELLRLVEEEGETIEVTDNGKVVARLVPTDELEECDEQEQIWADLRHLATEIGANWSDDIGAVDAVRDVRRDL